MSEETDRPLGDRSERVAACWISARPRSCAAWGAARRPAAGGEDAGSAVLFRDDPVAAGHGRSPAQPGGFIPGSDGNNHRLLETGALCLEVSQINLRLASNAKDVKHLQNRPKTDELRHGAGYAKVAERQMIRPSFVPPPRIRQLRDLTRCPAIMPKSHQILRYVRGPDYAEQPSPCWRRGVARSIPRHNPGVVAELLKEGEQACRAGGRGLGWVPRRCRPVGARCLSVSSTWM